MNKETKKKGRLELAVYGKGGIGKSTISANLSAALALNGKRVLQIGCDPKHDSTRLLLGGKRIPTVLEHLRDVPEEETKVPEILYEGWNGIGCIEAGGPQPGVGCAGRGIISAFEFLSKNRVKEQYDAIIYDVLGDVVCGGFAVPVRREYANTVVIVTSGEFMAIYAANNILRGILNYDRDRYCRVAGIIYNARNLAGEEERVRRFAEAVRLPVLACVPRSGVFAEAEEKNVPVFELNSAGKEQEVFAGLARVLTGEPVLYPACPLEDDELEKAVLGYGRAGMERGRMPGEADRPSGTDGGWSAGMEIQGGFDVMSTKEGPDDVPDTGLQSGKGRNIGAGTGLQQEMENAGDLPEKTGLQPEPEKDSAALSDSQSEQGGKTAAPSPRRMPLYGCAFNGAATTAVCLTDAVVIAHSPRACAFYTWQNISSSGRKGLFNRGILLPSAISPNFTCTDITRTEAVYGGTDKLRRAVETAVAQKPGAVIVVSSCVSGIIGDDVASVEELSTEEVPVIVIPADGDIAGDYMKGIQMYLRIVAERLVDRSVRPHGRTVNLIGEATLSTNLEPNYLMIRDLLARMDIGINCRFPGSADTAQLRNLLAAPVNILAAENADNLSLKEWLSEEFGCSFLDMPLPTGFEETARFTEKIAEIFSCPEKAKAVIREETKKYQDNIAALRPVLAGKRLLLTTISTGMDWLISAALDAGMKIVWVGVADYLHQGLNISRHPEVQQVTEALFDLQTAETRIREHRPDIVISNYTSAFSSGDYILDVLPMTLTQGFSSGVHILRRWALEFEHGKEGDWVHDRVLYQKYFA